MKTRSLSRGLAFGLPIALVLWYGGLKALGVL